MELISKGSSLLLYAKDESPWNKFALISCDTWCVNHSSKCHPVFSLQILYLLTALLLKEEMSAHFHILFAFHKLKIVQKSL